MDSLAASGPTGAALAQGVAQFLDLRFQEALQSFQAVSGGADPDPRLLSLLAAANLRLLNYGQASALYSQALSLSGTPPEKGGLKEASDRLGLALALFHQPDYERSLAEAGISWRIRNQMLGPADSKTLAAANSMATSLMALSRSAVAGDLLLEAVAQAIEGGADQSQPVMRDSLGILFLAFEAQGRASELQAFFQEPEPPPAPPADPSPQPPPVADLPGEPSPPVQPQPPLDPEEARGLIAHLKANHPASRVLPALALALAGDLAGPSGPPCREPFPADLLDDFLSLCLDVAKGYASVGELRESAAILDGLSRAGLQALPGGAALSRPRLVEALALLAAERAELLDLPASETALREARTVASSMPKDDEQTLPSLIILSLRLSDCILAQDRPPIEAELELVGGLTAIRKLYGNRAFEGHPLAPAFLLRLSWLVGSMGRARDAAAYRDQAGRSLKAVARAHPELQETTGLMSRVHAESRRRPDDAESLAHLWRPVLPANRPAQPPASPEDMRVELSALKLLGRLPEFSPLIDEAIRWSADAHGQGSPAHRRYQSLNLKFLEESGDLPALVDALDALALDPGTSAEPERTAIMTSALRYKARALEKAGLRAEALEALAQARAKILGSPALADRLPEIDAEMDRLGGE
jgi:tetratricopeptide (TPR) repeat protein